MRGEMYLQRVHFAVGSANLGIFNDTESADDAQRIAFYQMRSAAHGF